MARHASNRCWDGRLSYGRLIQMSRIVLIVGGRENRRLLREWASAAHSVTEHVPGEPLDETCDMCIVDGPGLLRFKDELGARRDQEQPGILPVLLLTSHRG